MSTQPEAQDMLEEEFEELEADVRMREAQGFDLGAAKQVAEREDEGQVVHVTGPDGEPAYYMDGDERKPVTITVAGSYSKTYRRAEEGQRRRNLKRRSTKVTPAQLDRNRRELIASCVLDWQGFFEAGRPLPCTKENVMRVLSAAKWIQYDVEAAMEDHAAFFDGSS